MTKKFIGFIFSFVFIFSMCFVAYDSAMAQESSEEKVYCTINENVSFSDDTIMVVLTNKASLSHKKYTVTDFPEIDCVEVEELTEELWEKVITHKHSDSCNKSLEIDEETFNRIIKLKIANAGKDNVIAGIRKLEKRTDVKGANPSYTQYSLDVIPDDHFFFDGDVWYEEKLQLSKAWDIETGSSSVLVGVIDSGIDNTNPDLANRVNTSLSKDFTGDDNPYLDQQEPHGTLVAGVIGAEGNNDEGIAGVCWDVSLVSLRAINNENQFDEKVANACVTKAICYATANNIPILNISLGLSDSFELETAVKNYKGLIVTSAGNRSVDIDDKNNFQYPACYPYENIIVVGASYKEDDICFFSNSGKTNVDIFAPGQDIWTTNPSYKAASYSNEDGNGTSIAAPFVTGVAALLLSHDSTLSAKAIKETILNNCDEIDDLSELCVTGGRLNAYKALSNPHKHSFKYSIEDDSNHTKTCECGYSVTEAHPYQKRYVKYDGGKHWAYCSCGAKKLAAHVIGQGQPSDNPLLPKICLLCKGTADFGRTYESVGQPLYVTPNGSYILPNGVIVLADADFAEYFNGTLTFMNTNAK